MPTARAATQDRKPAKKVATKATQRKSTLAEMTPTERARAASEAALATSAKTAGPVGPTAADLAAEAVPAVRPEGLPELRSLVSLTRRDRASFLRQLSRVTDLFPDEIIVEMQKQEGDPQAAMERYQEKAPNLLHLAADVAEMAAEADDLLKIVAIDQDAYTSWSASAPDDILMAAFGWYTETNPVGEASASPS